MAHERDHHSIVPLKMNTALIVGIILNFVFVLVEVTAGLINHSLSLLSDAGHNLADIGTLALSPHIWYYPPGVTIHEEQNIKHHFETFA